MNKRFTFFSLGAVAGFILYHTLVWFFYTSKILNPHPYYVGDLGRMSYQIDSIYPRKELINLPKRHLDRDTWHNQHVDLITIGDSFSNGMGSGKNPYYQDYLESDLNIRVLNIQSLDETLNYVESITLLYNSGWLAQVRPKAILIETVASGAFRRTVSDHPLHPLTQPQEHIFHKRWSRAFPVPMFINTANYKAPYYALMYHFNNHANKDVYKFDLNESFFSVVKDRQLLVYHEDIDHISDFNDENIQKINAALNTLAEKLKTLNITLYYMPAIDKYDLYYDYIIHKEKYPANPLFEKLQKEPKEYIFINTKQLFREQLQKNTKDLYFADDTHWNHKASEVISKSSYFKNLQ